MIDKNRKEAWRKMAKRYLWLIPEATKVIIVDQEGNVIEEITK